MRGRGEQALGLRNQAHDTAVIKQARLAALHARAINFQQQRQQSFDGEDAEENHQRARNVEIRPWNAEVNSANRDG